MKTFLPWFLSLSLWLLSLGLSAENNTSALQQTQAQNLFYSSSTNSSTLDAASTCPPVQNLKLSALLTTSVSLSWDGSTSDTYILLVTSVPQLDPGAAIASETVIKDTITVTSSILGYSYTVSGLTEGTAYYVYLKSDCTGTLQGYSEWSDVLAFSTPCSAQNLPYSENFDALVSGSTPSCWITSSTNEVQPMVTEAITGDQVNTTKVFTLEGNDVSETVVVMPLFNANIEDLMVSLRAKSTLDSMTMQVGITNDLSDVQNMVTLSSKTLSTDWKTYTIFMENAYITGPSYYIVFYFPSGLSESSNNYQVYFDDMVISTAPSCLYPLELTATYVLDHSANLTWINNNTSVIDYTVEYTDLSHGGAPQTVTATATPFTLTGLDPNTTYSVRVKTNCSTTDESAYSDAITIKTYKATAVVTEEVPFVEDFEGTENTLNFVNGNLNTAWAVGEATSVSPSHSLYISGDQGTTLGVTTSGQTSIVMAYMNVTVPVSGNYKLSFAWKGYGGSSYSSVMRIYLADYQKDIIAGETWSTGTNEPLATQIGEDIYRISNNSDWEQEGIYLNAPAAGFYRLVFYRYTSSSSNYIGDYTAIDDITIKYLSCDMPSDFTSSNVGQTTVDLAWTGSAANYTVKTFNREIPLDSLDLLNSEVIQTTTSNTNSVTVTGLEPGTSYYSYVQSQCDGTHASEWVGPVVFTTDCLIKDLPYTLNFDLEQDDVMPRCWVGTPNEVYVNVNPSSSYDINGTPVLQFSGTRLANQLAILPEFNALLAECVLEFDYTSASGGASGDFVVGYITDISDTTTFVPLDTFPRSSSKDNHVQYLYSQLPLSTTGRMAIMEHAGTSTSSIYGGAIDNLSVSRIPSCWGIASFATATALSDSSLTVNWVAQHNQGATFILEYGVEGFVEGNGTTVNVSDTSYTLTGLTENTVYDVYVKADCGETDGLSISTKGSFKTLVSPADGSAFLCTFEDANETDKWTFASAVGETAWEIGTQASLDGNNGLYTVDNSGTLGYENSTTDAWISRYMHCVPGLYTVTFDYKSEGQKYFDYMQNFVIPFVYVGVADDDGGASRTSKPDSWFSGDPISLYQINSWSSYTYQFEATEDKIYTLAFHWHNNSSGSYDPPVIDNVSVTRVTCRPAYALNLEEVTKTSLKVSWTAESYDHFEVIADTIPHSASELDTMTQAPFISSTIDTTVATLSGLTPGKKYFVYVRTMCEENDKADWSESLTGITQCTIAELPFMDNFESGTNNEMPLCWTNFSGDLIEVSGSEAYDGNRSLRLKTADATNIKVALPSLNMVNPIENYQLVFYVYRKESNDHSDKTIALLVGDNTSYTDLYPVASEEVTLTADDEDLWKRVVVPFQHPTDLMTGQDLVLQTEQTIYMLIPGEIDLYIDQVSIEVAPTCPEPYNIRIDSIFAQELYYSWSGQASSYEIECVNIGGSKDISLIGDTLRYTSTSNQMVVSGLTPHTTYSIRMRSVCGPDSYSSWSQAMTVTSECAREPLPYIENFSDVDEGNIPVCWTPEDGGSYDEPWMTTTEDNNSILRAGTETSHYSVYSHAITSTLIDLTGATHATLSFQMKTTSSTDFPTLLAVKNVMTGDIDTIITSILALSDWNKYETSLEAYVGQVIQVTFSTEYQKKAIGYVSLDDVSVEDRLFVEVPVGLRAGHITTNSVTAFVSPSATATAHEVVVIPEDELFDADNITAPITTMTAPDSVIVTGLQANTYYKIYFRTVVGSAKSLWAGSVHFGTDCTPQNLPLVEDFEDVVQGNEVMPLCWTLSSTASNDAVSISTTYPINGLASVKIETSGLLISPEIVEEVNTAQLYFNAISTSNTVGAEGSAENALIVRVGQTASDVAFMTIDTIQVNTDHSNTYSVDFSQVPAGYHYVVLENEGSTTIYLDNVTLRTATSCSSNLSVALNSVEKGQVNLLISSDGVRDASALYDVYYDYSANMSYDNLGVTSPDGTATLRTSVSDSCWLTDLASFTQYDVFVRKVCDASADNKSQWVGPITFQSACNSTLLTEQSPYIMDLSDLTQREYSLPECWEGLNITGSSSSPYAYRYYSSSGSYIKATSGSSDSIFMVLPEFENPLNMLNFSFGFRVATSSYSAEELPVTVGAMTDATDPTSFIALYDIPLEGLRSTSFVTISVDLRYMDIPDSTHFLAIRLREDSHYFRFNDFKVEVNNTYDAPSLKLTSVTSNSITLDVNSVGLTNTYDLCIEDDLITYQDTIWDIDASQTSYTISGLTPGTNYRIKARSTGERLSDMGTDDPSDDALQSITSDWSSALTASLPFGPVTSFPYLCDFENSTENASWILDGGSLTNQWIIGTNTDGRWEGQQGLYISKDNNSASYDVSANTFTWAKRTIHMEPGEYKISFMAKVGGDDHYDFMRAFLVDLTYNLVPCDYTTSDLDVFGNAPLEEDNVPQGFIDLLGDTHYISTENWVKYSYDVVIVDTVDYQLAFLWVNNHSSGTQPGANVDSIMVDYNSCPSPKDVTFISKKYDRVLVKAEDKLENPTARLTYAVVARGDTPSESTIISQDTALTGVVVSLGQLMPETAYDLYIARMCTDGSRGAWSTALPFTSSKTPASLPYFCGFESNETETSLWTLANDNTNRWIIDTAAHAEGTSSLYITSDSVSYSYDATVDQHSFAYRTIHFTPGRYSLKFIWQARGESTKDYMSVFLTPDSTTMVGGANTMGGININYTMQVPYGYQKIGNYDSYAVPQQASEIISIEQECDMNLLIMWDNNYSGGSNPPAFIDSISIKEEDCTVPTNMMLSNLRPNAATLTWDNDVIATHLSVTAEGSINPTIDTLIQGGLVDPTDVSLGYHTSFELNNLMAGTTYTYELYTVCSEFSSSIVTPETTFTTPCSISGLPFDEDFEAVMPLPTCWDGLDGSFNLTSTEGNTLSHSTAWTRLTGNNSPSAHERLTLNGTNSWMVTPLINLPMLSSLSFDVALTAHNSWNAPTENNADNKFAVMISTDYGDTWQPLALWGTPAPAFTGYPDNTSMQYELMSSISNSFTTKQITITSANDNTPVYLAFYGESSADNTALDLHIDNVHVNCFESDTLVINDTICEGYAYGRHGFIIPKNDVATGQYTKLILGDATTCDQYTELHLLVNPTYENYTTASICEGQSYNFGGLDLMVAGDYQNTMTSVSGCDSISHLTLRVLPTQTTIDTTICEGDFVEIDGVPYTTSGLYKDTLQNVLHCDSIVTLNLTVIPSDTMMVDQFCEGSTYLFRGERLTEGGVYRDTVYNYMGLGCEHHYILTLTQTMVDSVRIADEFCTGATSYSNYGFEIDDPRDSVYTRTLTSAITGCDSVTVLTLSSIETLYSSISQTICENESFTFGGKDYFTSGTYTATFTALSTGCDSIVTLNLQVNPTYEVNFKDTITTDELPYNLLTLTVPEGTDAGLYDYRIEGKTQAGCDSIVNLNLSITKPNGLNSTLVHSLQFYPNVVNKGESVTITSDFSASQREAMTIRLLDATGKIISSYEPSTTGVMQYAMPHVSGLYFLNISLKNGEYFSGKLIVL